MSTHYVSVDKPCEEALADLVQAYNKLADKIEAEWEKSARLEARIAEERQLRHEMQTRYALAEARCERLEGALRWLGDNYPKAIREMPTDLYRALAEEPHADVPPA